MSTAKKYLHIVRRVVWYSAAVFIIVIAVLVSLLRIFLPDVTGYRSDLEQIASTFLDHTVRIESMDARLVGFTPTLIFNDVHMLDKTGKRELVRFKQARLGIALIESLRKQRVVPSDFTVEGIQLAITRRKDGRFLVQGIDVSQLEKTFNTENTQGSGELSNWLFRRTRIALRKSTILWKDLKQGGDVLRFDDVSVELKNDNKRHQLNGHVQLPEEMGKQFEIAMDVTGDILNPYEMRGKIYMRGDSIHLDKWGVKPQYMGVVLHTGMADFQLWGEWRNAAIQQLSGDLTTYNLKLSLPIMDKPFHLKLMSGLFDVNQSEHGWKLNIDRFQYMSADDVWPETRFQIQHQPATESRPAGWEVKAEYFRVEDIAGLLQQTNILDKQQRKFLATVQPAGDIRWFHVSKSVNNKDRVDYQVQASFKKLAAKAWQSAPGFTGLDGELWGNMNKGRLKLDSSDTTLDFPRLFRWPIKLNKLQGNMQWSRNEKNLQVWTRDLRADNDDVELSSSVLLAVPMQKGISPYLDLQAQFKNGNAEFAERYYPTGIMNRKVVNWLDRSIVSGRVTQGGVVFNGRLKDFPFRRNQGQFKVEFDGEDVVLDYQKGWPQITRANMAVLFTGQSIDILIKQARLFNSTISDSPISIPKFSMPVLHIQGDASGGLEDVANFLVESPAAPGAREFVKEARFEGKAHTRFKAEIPLSRRTAKTRPTRYQGQVTINKGALYLLQDRLDLTTIQGKVVFSEDGITSNGLQAEFLGGDTHLELTTQAEADSRRFSILANGELDVAKAAKRFGFPGAQLVSGTSSWHGAVVLNTGNKRPRPPLVRVVSNLDGVEAKLPPPLNKSKEEEIQLVLQAQFAKTGRTTVLVNLADRINSQLELQDGKTGSSLHRGYVHLGPGQGQLPEEPVLLVTGALDAFRSSDWISAFYNGKSPDSKSDFLSRPIRIAMDRLILAKNEQTDAGKPAGKDDKFPPPPNIPNISGYITHLQYHEYPLGRADFEVSSLQKGLRLQRLALQGENIRLNASGNWLYQRKRHLTDINFELASPNMGKMLDNFGFSAIITGGDMVARGRLEWDAPPAQIDLASLKGKMDLQVEDGSIVRVKPGAGRLLGLFSLSALPRRLMLDFRDTFQEGFSFDRMQGQMQFRDGSVYTDDLSMESPVAEIRVEGRTGLVNEDFDQYVTVVPKVGDTLPVAGGLLFGSQVGAVILFFEKLLGGEIDEASTQRYHITGSWEEPNIVPLGEAPSEETGQNTGD